MPHVVIHCFKATIPGTHLQRIEAALTRLLLRELSCDTAAISIDLQQVEPSDWMALVYRPLIQPRLDELLRRPGYVDPAPTS